jgi:hypothetical protein
MRSHDMNTISVQANSAALMNHPQALNVAFPSGRTVAQWLPAPPVAKRQPARATASANRLWVPSNGESLGEKSMLFGLVLAAAIGISYGFMCLVNLVENWAAVQASVGHMLQ